MNTSGIEKKTLKHKSTKKKIDATNVHYFLIKCITIKGKDNGKFGGVSSLSKPKEFKCKTLKKEVDNILLLMSDLTDEVSETLWNTKVDKEPEVTCNPSSTTVNIESSPSEGVTPR